MRSIPAIDVPPNFITMRATRAFPLGLSAALIESGRDGCNAVDLAR
jgi:hypothetical protein